MVTDALVTWEEVKDQLNLTSNDAETDIMLKASIATAQVIDYLKRPDHGWDDESVPDVVKGAILKQVVYLYRYRGDDEFPTRTFGADYPGEDEGLAPGLVGMLRRMRDPALA